MPDWQQWLTQNAPWLNSLGSLVTILTGIAGVLAFVIVKPLRERIVRWWSSLRYLLKRATRQTRATLHFVSMNFPETQWIMGTQGDKPVLFIVTRWHVTHEPGSGSGLPVRLLKVHLQKPFAKYLLYAHLSLMSGQYVRSRAEDTIPEGETRTLIIQCHFSKVLKPGKPIKVRLALEDQLANKHTLPPVTVLPGPVGK
jgi:hypothetical protein